MEHDFIKIFPNNSIGKYDKSFDLRALHKILNAPLQVSKIFMNKEDYDDIVAWGKSK